MGFRVTTELFFVKGGWDVEKISPVEKSKFDSLLRKVIRTKPAPREKIKTSGKRGPKTAILAKP